MPSSGQAQHVPADALTALAERSQVEPFRGFACWSPDEVGDIMHREAAAPSRAVLLATHQPPRIRRVTVTRAGSYGSDDLVTQEQFLNDVVDAADKSLIVPVIGASGTGKSHLVLWMKARLDDAASPNRKIIYVPKGETSLSRVIDLILDGRTGGHFDAIRSAVANATRNMSMDEAARRLRNELAVAANDINPAAGPPGSGPYREHLKAHLADLLDDPAYAEHLVGEGQPLRRIVEQALSGGSEEPAELKPEDLAVGLTAAQIEGLSKPARDLLGHLQDPKLHQTAIDVLNEVRDRCLSRIFGVEPMQLVAVMRELRTTLHEENPELELVLMIEDFTLLQGIQHDLLEAMIELPTRGGEQVLCAMTTVMAVTEGFFTSMLASNDTLRTRIADMGHVYNLDVPYGTADDGFDQETVTQFVGRYLNAARVGVAAIDSAAPGVPNACGHCAHRAVCHDAFGTSGEDEYGLYPFNAAAIDRAIRSRQATFNPRDALSALGQTLTVHASELADGRFPSSAWERLFDPRQFGREPLPRLSLQTQELVEALPKPEQRRILLTFWGGVPPELVNLPAGIHEAFDIPRVDDATVVTPRPPKAVRTTTVAPATDDTERAIQAWRDGARLDAERARTLRRLFRDAIVGALDGEDELLSPQLIDESFSDRHIDIERAAGGGRLPAGKFKVEFAPTNEHALMFVGLLRAQHLRSWNFDEGPRALVAFLTRVETEARRLRAFIAESAEQQRSDVDAAIAMLALTGLAAGSGTPADARGLIPAAISTSDTVSDTMPDLWRALRAQCDQRRPIARSYALQTAHVSKSTADPMGIDATRLLAPLKTLQETWAVPEISESAPQQLQTLRKVLVERLAPALQDAHTALTDWSRVVHGLVGDTDTAAKRAKTWREELDRAAQKGFLVGSGASGPESKLAQLETTMRFVDGVLAGWESSDAGRQIAAIAKTPWARLSPLREQLESLEKSLEASADKAATQLGGSERRSPVDEFVKALDELEAACRIGEEAK